jgi:NhaA family Na+:H+ antiporter
MNSDRSFHLSVTFNHFFKSEKAGGLLLIFCTLLSLLIANTAQGPAFIHFWHSDINLSFGTVSLDYSVEEWINDGWMTIFFLMVGLEIERELYVGELSDVRNALLPLGAAIGGMLVPALIHLAFNLGEPTQKGIGIPMATDIAFSLGILSLLGKRVPPALKIFLTALAIIDDLGAIIVIAVFYTKGFSLVYLSLALGIFAILFILNRLKVYVLWAYLLPGLLMWYFMLKSGVHATISGVLLAFVIPFAKDSAKSPSLRLQRGLHNLVNYLILPVFALTNTCLRILPGWYRHLAYPNDLGIIAGLVAGKPAGIFLFSWLAVKMNWCRLPRHVTWKKIFGSGILAGVGFTMSIFITNLAFTGEADLISDSKFAVLIASLTAGIAGWLTLRSASRKPFPAGGSQELISPTD